MTTAYARSKAPITLPQIKRIHTLKTALGIEDEVYRQLLQNHFNVTSSKHLDRSEAAVLIGVMEARAVECGVWQQRDERTERYGALTGRPGMASPEQLRKIEATWQVVSRLEDLEERAKALRHFVVRTAKVSDLRFLDRAGAGKVLNALKAMKGRTSATAKTGNARKGR